ncbi:MAG TPA: hypothetical protein VNG93_10385 [Candidatus Dormibacteraeota bacterium]|nr:hypothetical protein [Candidatus Dormibacteraeota bacterium]
MRIYTAVQLAEVTLFFGVLMGSLLPTPNTHPSLAAVGGGLLVGKAVLNILAPEGGSILRRSLIGYSAGAVFIAIGIVLIHVI